MVSESPVWDADLCGEAGALHSLICSSSAQASIDDEALETTHSIIHVLALICCEAHFHIQHKEAFIWSLCNHRNMKQLEILWLEGLELRLGYEIGLK